MRAHATPAPSSASPPTHSIPVYPQHLTLTLTLTLSLTLTLTLTLSLSLTLALTLTLTHSIPASWGPLRNDTNPNPNPNPNQHPGLLGAAA